MTDPQSVSDDQYSDALKLFVNDSRDLCISGRIDTGGSLVQDEKLVMLEQGSCHDNELLLTGRKAVRSAIEHPQELRFGSLLPARLDFVIKVGKDVGIARTVWLSGLSILITHDSHGAGFRTATDHHLLSRDELNLL
jgi:hypothetical protein